jgi:hypothetical protein
MVGEIAGEAESTAVETIFRGVVGGFPADCNDRYNDRP